MRTSGWLLATVALSACAAPDRPTPEAARVTPPAGWRSPLAGTAPIDAQWWQRFGDPVLAALVTEALANNPDVAIAAARAREARGQETIARAQRFPGLDAGVGITTSRAVSGLGTAVESTGASPVFQAAYEVDLFGRIGEQVAAARATSLSSEAAQAAARLSVAAATASGYLTLRSLDARLEIVHQTIASRQEAVRLARSRAEAGYTSQLELRQAEAEFEATAQVLPQVQLAITRQEDALSLLVGANPRAIARGLALDALRRPPIPAGLPSELLRRRPDIVQAEFALAASDSNLAAARAQFLPSLRLTGSAGEALSTSLTNPVGVWSIGASILAPLFQGGRLRGGVDVAAARRDQAAFGYQRTVLTAFRETEDALAAVQRLGEQRARLDAQRLALAEALRHAQNRYRAGYSSYLEQLDAQRSLFNVELSLVQVEADQLAAHVALYQAMGGGWSDADVQSD